MNRLTFEKPDGSYGIVGMNEDNQVEKLFACIRKLYMYENSGRSPYEVLTQEDKHTEELRKEISDE